MSVSVVCRGCGRRVRFPDGVDPRKAKCSKCRTPLTPPDAALPRPVVTANGKHPAPPPALSLDDAPEPALSLDEAEPPQPISSPAAALPPPPFRFTARIVADTHDQLRGTLPAVLTAHGVFLEAAPNRPAAFAPVGSRASADGSVVVLTLPDRVLTFHVGGVGLPDALAADTVAFLSGTRPVPDPADYRRPLWLLGIGATLALGLAAGPVVMAQVTDLNPGVGLVLGLIFAGLAAGVNAGIALLTRYPVWGKVALMAGVCVAMLAVFLFGAVAYLTGRKHEAGPVVVAPSPLELPPAPPPPPDVPPPPEPISRGPPTHFEVALRDGRSRLDDGPAAVTAIALSPTDGAVVVGYADGTTRVWPADQPAFEPPRPGPRGDGAVRRIAFDPTAATGADTFLFCDRGLALAKLRSPRPPVVVPGDAVAVWLEPRRERFAASRGGRLYIRYVPVELVKDPLSGGRLSASGQVASTPKDETLPRDTLPTVPLPKPTFLTWHASGRLLSGSADGTISSWPLTGAAGLPIRAHKAAVRTWAVGPAWGDFATGDDGGFVGYWPNRSLAPPTPFRAAPAAVTHLALGPNGGELAVADAAGGLAVWHLPTKTKLYETKRPQPAGALTWGPRDDVLLVADGKGVDVLWLPEMAACGSP